MNKVTARLIGGGIAALLALPLAAAAASPVTATALDYTQVTDATLAAHWGLEEPEVARYRRYMALEGRFFYAHLDPVMVLGIIESDPKRQARYAEQYLMAERQRIAAQTMFAQAVGAAQQRLFGKEKYVDFSQLPQAAAPVARPSLVTARGSAPSRSDPAPIPRADPATLRAGDTVDVLVDAACQAGCFDRLRTLVQTPDVHVLLYGRDFPDAAALVAWLEAGLASWTEVERQTAATRIQPRHFDPVVFADIASTPTPVVLVRRNGRIVGRLF